MITIAREPHNRPPVRRGGLTWRLLESIVASPGARWADWAAEHWPNYSTAGSAVFRLRMRGLVEHAQAGSNYGRCWPTRQGVELING